ncbi:MAG TPA: thioesterase [Gammaproteobacteria bacterium]
MQVTLKPGIKYRHKFILPPTKTVPSLYPRSGRVPRHARGIRHRLSGVGQHQGAQSTPRLARRADGWHPFDVSHEAATPPGLEITADVELIEVDGRRLVFHVEAHDGIDLISKGRHERVVINKKRFDEKVASKNTEKSIPAPAAGIPT